MKEIYIFTHIPKTSGTSFCNNILKENIRSDRIYSYRGLKKLWRDFDPKKFDAIIGHVPYGVHFPMFKAKYIVLLRNPLERAISHYYFVLGWSKHPEFKYARSMGIEGFSRRSGNLQTRYIAGLFWGWLYQYLNGNSLFKRCLLAKAKSNLQNKYFFFGFQEKYSECVECFSKITNFVKISTNPKLEKKTLNKISVEEHETKVIGNIKKANSLDFELYDFGVKVFERNWGGQTKMENL